MKAYLLYKDKSVLGFKKFLNSGGDIFDSYRALASSFIRYANSDLDKNLAMYSNSINIEGITLETVYPVKYKWLVRDRELKDARDFLLEVEKRILEFQGKEDNLKILVGILFIKFVLITKINETYLASISALAGTGVDTSKIDLDRLGIGNSVMRFFEDMENLTVKTVDDWLAYKSDPVEARYFYSAMKRILTILIGRDN